MTHRRTERNELRWQVEGGGAAWIQTPAQLLSPETGVKMLFPNQLTGSASPVSYRHSCVFYMTEGPELAFGGHHCR